MNALNCMVLATALMSTLMGCRKATLPNFVTSGEQNVMETEPCFPRFGKGGVGTVGTDLYAITNADRNELVWGSGGRWIGRKASRPEVIVFFDGKVWPPQALPHYFDKNKSVVVSFEAKNIRFYDYVEKVGCNYERRPEN